jgi:predicted TIM-barrel fold metal-dependent hydrolase
MQIENYYIAGVKIHPNVSEIDLGTWEGKKRVERIIGASDRFNLPVIIHGGRNNILDNDRSRFAELSNFQDIDLRSSTPVVIAHGGAYGLRASEVSDEIVPVLKKLLSKYDNLYIDVAGLSDDIILLFLSFIGTDRILFGSDALYENQAVMGMRLLFALERSHLNVEDSLIRILSSNAARIIFREGPNKQKVAKAESIEDQKQELDL